MYLDIGRFQSRRRKSGIAVLLPEPTAARAGAVEEVSGDVVEGLLRRGRRQWQGRLQEQADVGQRQRWQVVEAELDGQARIADEGHSPLPAGARRGIQRPDRDRLHPTQGFPNPLSCVARERCRAG